MIDLSHEDRELICRCYLAQEEDVAKLLASGAFRQEILDEALVISSRRRHGIPIMELLLKNGANLRYVGFAGKTAFEWATEERITRNIDYLKTKGAHSEGAESGPADDNERSLLLAVKKNDYAEVVAALDNGANPNTTDRDGRPAVEIAAERRYPYIAALLVERGAEVNQVSSPISPSSVLDYLSDSHPGESPQEKSEREKVCEWLRANGAKTQPEIDIESGNSEFAGLDAMERLKILDQGLRPGRREFDRQLVQTFDQLGPVLRKSRVE